MKIKTNNNMDLKNNSENQFKLNHAMIIKFMTTFMKKFALQKDKRIQLKWDEKYGRELVFAIIFR